MIFEGYFGRMLGKNRKINGKPKFTSFKAPMTHKKDAFPERKGILVLTEARNGWQGIDVERRSVEEQLFATLKHRYNSN